MQFLGRRLLVISVLAAVPLFGAYVSGYTLWETRAGELATGLQSGWGDLLSHVRAAIFFAEQGGWPRESFYLSGEPVGYAFFADFLSGALWKAGVPLAAAFALPTMVLSILFLGGLEWLTWFLTRSRLAAVFSALLFTGFGGLSGWAVLREILAEPSLWAALRTLPHGVTAWHEANLVLLNPFIMMLHQRSYLLGFPLFLLLVFLLSRFMRAGSLLLLSGITAGGLLLAFFHPFTWVSFLLLFPSAVAWTWMLRVRPFTRRDLLGVTFALLMVSVGGFSIVRALQPHASASVIRWHPGWLAPGLSWAPFWIGNLGIFVPLSLVAVRHLLRHRRPLAALVLAGLTPFAAGNLFLFAPWDFDNTKIFAPVWILLAIGAGTYLASLWRRFRKIGKAMVGVLLLVLVWSGSVEIARVFTHRTHPLVLGERADRDVGMAVRRLADRRDIILAAPVPNHPVFLFSGRPSFLAYEGWLWSQGWRSRYEGRLADLMKMYAGAPEAPELFRKHRIAFVVLGPPEEASDPSRLPSRLGRAETDGLAETDANAAWFEQRYPRVLSLNGYRLYDVRLGAPGR